MKGTIFEKIIKQHSSNAENVVSDEVISIRIDNLLLPDNCVMPIFELLEYTKIKPVHKNIYVALTNFHYQYEQNYSINQRKIIDYAKKYNFQVLENHKGIWNINLLELNKIASGSTFLVRDSTVNFFAPLNNLNISSGIQDLFKSITTGYHDYLIPEIIKVNLEGTIQPNINGKNIALLLKKELSSLTQHRPYLIEFSGALLPKLTANDLFTLSLHHYTMNRAAFMFPPLPQFNNLKNGVYPDADAEYSKIFNFDLSKTTPLIDVNGYISEVTEISGEKIDKVYIGNSVGGLLDDLEFLAKILSKHKVSVPTYIIPASTKILEQAVVKDYIRPIIEAGCTLITPATGLCSAINDIIPVAGEKILATGYNDLSVQVREIIKDFYNCSIDTAVATAIKGEITTLNQLVRSIEG